MQLISTLINKAYQLGASDLHLEPGVAPAMRVRGRLQLGDTPLTGADLHREARQLAGEELWSLFIHQRSIDLSRRLGGIRCRLNIFQTSRGIAFAIRLLSSRTVSIRSLNLHPVLAKLANIQHGLVLVCGPTGSGKSTTLSALLEEINSKQARHIITIEHPIEYEITPKRSFVRQREIGRDSPSFKQALLDSLREDPDVILVGEMRTPETMALTLAAAETGHLVFSTVHSASATEALQRIVSSFPADGQANICAQLADCLSAVVCQRLIWREDVQVRVPQCEILMATKGVKGSIRQNQLYRIPSLIETGGPEGMWTFTRYGGWLAQKKDLVQPKQEKIQNITQATKVSRPSMSIPSVIPAAKSIAKTKKTPSTTQMESDGVLNLDEDFDDPASIIAEFLHDKKS